MAETRTHTRSHADAPGLGVLYLLFVLSGVAALVYELMWMRSFSLVFGSTTRSASAVLASFFLGMAIGNGLGGRWARERNRALLRYGLVELVVAGGAVLVMVWVELYRDFYPQLYRSWLGEPARLTLLQLGLALAAMALPCIAMGTTLPLVSRAVVTRVGHLGRRVGGIYALNTLGATIGVMLSGFLLPAWLGTRGSVQLAAALNVAVGLGAIGLWLRWRRAGEESIAPAATGAVPASAATPRRGPGGLLAFAAAVSGFGTLALEILYLRLIVNAIDSSVYSFALVLAVFLVALALGSALVSLVVDRLRTPWVLVGLAAAVAAPLVLLSPLLFQWVSGSLAMRAPGWGFLARVAALAGLLMGTTAVLVGMILPTVWKIATREVHDVGAKIGRLTSINTLAGVAGSLVAGFVLVPVLGVGHGAASIAALYGALALIALAHGLRGGRRVAVCAAVVVVLALASTLRPWRAAPLYLPAAESVVALYEGEGGTVVVTRKGRARFLRLNSRYGLGGTDPVGVRSHRAQGELPLALHPEPRSVAFIGIATGISLSAVLDHPSVERVVAMELIPGVVAVADHFASANRGVLGDPRVETVIADGRNHLFGAAERFDVIVGDLFIPWHAGTAYLYTVEHFRIVAQRLNPGGVFVQWLQADQVSVEELRTIVASFSDAFEHLELWLHAVERRRPLVGLVGWAGGRPASTSRALGLEGVQQVAGAERLRRWAASAVRNTDDRPIIEFSAAAGHLERTRREGRKVLAVLRRLRAGSEASDDPS